MEAPRHSPARPWWLALAALVIATPWGGVELPTWAAASVALGLLILARPSGRARLPWLAVLLALTASVVAPARPPSEERLSQELDRHVAALVRTAERTATQPELLRLFAASGETLDPRRPFVLLARAAAAYPGRTAYLSDDRGMLVAWGGEDRAYPGGLRPLGDRRLGVVWSARQAVLYVREPVILEGKLVGAVTVADRSPLESAVVWGMRAPAGGSLRLGQGSSGGQVIRAPTAPGIEVPVGLGRHDVRRQGLRQLAWLLLAGLALMLRPRLSPVMVLAAGLANLALPGPAGAVAVAMLMLALGLSVARAGPRLPKRVGRLLVVAAILAASAAVLVVVAPPLDPLPEHLLGPGWGGVWVLAVAFAAAGWPELAAGRPLRLERRLLVAGLIAVLGLALEVARVPISLERAVRAGGGVVLPRDPVDLAAVLPVAPSSSRLDDVASVLAESWGLERWRTPSLLRLVDASEQELSRWGDLTLAGDDVRRIRVWSLGDPAGARIELWVATEPWGLLADWESGEPRGAARSHPVWFAALTRSGTVAATLHDEVRDLDPETAGALYHAGGGWATIGVGDEVSIARLRKQGEWLVAAIGRYPGPVVWVLQTAIGSLWALAGLLVALPPVVRREHLSTFGGRLRLLVSGAVVVPLVVLTVFLHLRLQREVERFDQLVGLDALDAARYTANQLSGGFAVDDEIARWVAAGWGGEVLLFEGTDVVAVSRPDLLATGVLPQLPPAEALRSYLIGRDDAVVERGAGRLAAAGPIQLEGRRLLLELVRLDPRLEDAALSAVDWPLTGALLAAVLALALTSRIERRLSVSLRDLVQLSRQLLDGRQLPEVRRPVETDLAEVLDAVRSMNEQVQRRETSLRYQEELLRITLSTLAPAVVVLEPSGQVRFTNPSADALLEEYGERLLEVVRETAAEAPEGRPSEARSVQPVPGRELTWRVGVAGVPLPDGTRGLVGVVDDITDVVRMDRMRQLNQLARIVAHEVKNPLTPIRLWVQELEEARRSGEERFEDLTGDACREISLQVDRLQAMANSFSNLVALESWEPEVIDVGSLVNHTLGGLTIFERRGISLVADVQEGEGCRVRADRQWLQRAIGNLVKNSLDALGSGAGEVRARVRCSAGTVVVEVEDSAGGLPEGQLQDLFSPHFSTTTAGSGLGLALVQQVVARCHGKVTAENGERGLVVRIELPAATPGQ